ncbi:MAG: hypothetical protein Q7S62_03400 [bacterium]|nr:hypothetical protein [bacterium]
MEAKEWSEAILLLRGQYPDIFVGFSRRNEETGLCPEVEEWLFILRSSEGVMRVIDNRGSWIQFSEEWINKKDREAVAQLGEEFVLDLDVPSTKLSERITNVAGYTRND